MFHAAVGRSTAVTQRATLLGLIISLIGLLSGGFVTLALVVVGQGFLEPIPPEVRVAMVAGIVVLVFVSERPGARAWWPERTKMIPPTHIDHGYAGIALFSHELGLGWRTRLPSLLPFALAVALLSLRPSLLEAGMAVGGWSLGRWYALVRDVLERGAISQCSVGRKVFPRSISSIVGAICVGALAFGPPA